ncbi:hypothetical protein TEK04_19600 [Klenkia sp. LSe6-5]|uniref:Uncharacterized protein n=1 Tax=Klenkia sesuvii TaxID=3103137 RepID=A0ABU8E0X3_9ACTN
MAVIHTTVGFKGSTNQIGEAKRLAKLGPRATVADAAAWKVSHAAGDRTVTVAAGSGQACGVDDTTVAVDTIGPFPPNGTASTATRWDMVVARWKWTDPVTPVEFVHIAGVPGAAGPDLTKLVRNPGTQMDMVIGVVRVAGGQGALSANDIFDPRVWAGTAGPLQASPGAYLAAIDGRDGERLDVGNVAYRYSSGWKYAPGQLIGLYDGVPGWTGSGTFGGGVAVGDSLGIYTFNTPDPGQPYEARITLAVEAGSAAAGTRWDFFLGRGNSGNAMPATQDMPFLFVAEDDGRPRYKHQISRRIQGLTGPASWRLVAKRIYGTGDGVVAGNKLFSVEIIAATS